MQPNPNRTLLLRLSQLAGLGAMALLGLLDMAAGILRGNGLIGVAQFLLALGAAAVWLPRRTPNSIALPKAAALFGGFSLFVTVGTIATRPYVGVWGLAESAAMLGILFTIGRRAAPRWGVAAAVTVGAAVAFAPLRSGEADNFIIFGLIQALAATAALGGGLYLRTIESSRQRAMDSVRAEQRAEFARDLHDFIAHHVTGIVVQAQGARFIVEQDPKRALLALEQIEQAGAETMASMRRMVGVLRDPDSEPDAPLAPVAGVPDLEPLLEQFNAAGGPTARLHVDGSADGLPVEVSTSAYRVVMEALTNIRQHAPEARVADVWIRRTPEWLLVRVANDGPLPKQSAPRERAGYGLMGLTERVRAVGGRITSGAGIEGGWVVDVAFPLNVKVVS